LDLAQIKTRHNGIHQPAFKQSLGRHVAQNAAVNLVVLHLNLGDRAARDAHAHADPRTLKSRSGSGRRAEQAPAIPDYDFSIRAQIQQRIQALALAEVRS
jgi:hypothetical protein